MKSVFFFFIDGLGIGQAGEKNPLSVLVDGGFSEMAGCRSWTEEDFTYCAEENLFRSPIDARLGIEGLPQSGTGQATIFTGVNCAGLAERHYGPYPHSSSRLVLAKSNLYHQVGPTTSAFANAYPRRFFDYAKKRNRWSTTTRCCLEAGVAIRTIADLENGVALAADLTGSGLTGVAETEITKITEREAARRIAGLCDEYRLVVFEYFHTDKAGHAQNKVAAARCCESIDRFLSGLLEFVDFDSSSVVISSDHGNIEDLGVKTHTLNAVPLVVRGPAARFFKSVNDLTGIAGAITAATAS